MKRALSWNDRWEKRSTRGEQEYVRIIEIDADFDIQHVYIELEPLPEASIVLINDTQIGHAEPGALIRLKVTDSMHVGRNELVVRSDAEPGGGRLISYDKVSISGISIDPEVADNIANVWITIDVANHTRDDQPVLASVVVSQGQAREKIEISDVVTPFGGEIEAIIRITDPTMWETDESGEPQYFDCLIGLQIQDEIMDVAAVRFDVEES